MKRKVDDYLTSAWCGLICIYSVCVFLQQYGPLNYFCSILKYVHLFSYLQHEELLTDNVLMLEGWYAIIVSLIIFMHS